MRQNEIRKATILFCLIDKNYLFDLKNCHILQKIGARSCIFAFRSYLCIVFFIVLDLRLTRLGYSGIPFFLPLCFVAMRRGVCRSLILFFASPYWMCSTGKPEGANVQSIFLFVRAERSTRRAESANVQLIFLFVRAWRSTRRAESPTFSS